MIGPGCGQARAQMVEPLARKPYNAQNGLANAISNRECAMIDMIFDLCVQFLVWLAGWIGISYKAVNVWIFVIIWPIFTLALMAIVIIQQRALGQARRAAEPGARLPLLR